MNKKYDAMSSDPFNSLYLGAMNPIGQRMSKDKSILTGLLVHKHMIETIERFEWKNLPPELNQDLIERILYFRFKGALFKYNDKYYFLPFTLKGEIDSYGRYINLLPVLFTGQWKNNKKEDIAFMSNLAFKAIYDLPGIDTKEIEETAPEANSELDRAVILTDSSLQISQSYSPMEYNIRPLIEQMVDILVLVNMDLINSAKVYTIVARDEDQKLAIEAEFENLDQKILSGKRVVVVTSDTALDELTGSNSKDSARYFQSFQSIDNIRKSIIGIDNGGTFMKQEHMTDMETEVNSSGADAVLNNALRMRKEFVKIANATFGLNMEVDIKGSKEDLMIAPEGEHSKQQRGEEDE